jgi:hypothetical protein
LKVGGFSCLPALAVSAKRRDPLTRPAPAGENAGSGPSPARGEGRGIRGNPSSALIPRAPSSATADLRPLGEG